MLNFPLLLKLFFFSKKKIKKIAELLWKETLRKQVHESKECIAVTRCNVIKHCEPNKSILHFFY